MDELTKLRIERRSQTFTCWLFITWLSGYAWSGGAVDYHSAVASALGVMILGWLVYWLNTRRLRNQDAQAGPTSKLV